MTSKLFLFQIGPVQSFIAAARRTQDLYVGSRLLSVLSAAGVAAALRSDVALIFPAQINGELPTSVPHRFAFVSDAEPDVVTTRIRESIVSRWREIADAVGDWLYQGIGDGPWIKTYQQQVENWLEFYWVAVPYRKSQHRTCYRHATGAMAARKHARYFPQVYEEGLKCSLTGAQSALPLTESKKREDIARKWQELQIIFGETIRERVIADGSRRPPDALELGRMMLRDSERLGSLAMIKRVLQLEHSILGKDAKRQIPDIETIAGKPEDDDKNPYFLTVLHIDGDRMGQRLASINNIEEHQTFSQQLAQFAQWRVPTIVDQYDPGVLIYAGGDDVLALLPLWAAIPCANELQAAFTEEIGGTMSAGISITPYKLPLDGALESAREAEHMAKEQHGRQALVVREAHRSGQIRQAGAKWNICETVTDLQSAFAANELSSKLGHDLLNAARQIGPYANSKLADVLAAEFRRLLKRRIIEGVPADRKKVLLTLDEDFAHFGQSDDCGWESLANWVIIAKFLATGNRLKGEQA